LTRAQQNAFNALVVAVDEMTDRMEERQGQESDSQEREQATQERDSQEREQATQERDSQERESQETQVRPQSFKKSKSQKVTELGNARKLGKSRRAR